MTRRCEKRYRRIDVEIDGKFERRLFTVTVSVDLP